ncbi:MAG: M20 family metallopeptidase [Anaerolineae bacterium]|nr:M20 family metallopeptidase [Anaerolineae bacterium]
MSDYLAYFQQRAPEMVALLKRLVLFESPSHEKPLTDAISAFVGGLCADLGATVEVFPRAEVGDIRLARWNEGAPGQPILILAHLDTVWPAGTLATMPLREEDGILYGPGALDMKCGVVVALEALRGLRDRDELPARPLWILFNTDEETGSQHSRELICATAAQAGVVWVMEPAADGEALKTWRKGIARYTVRTTGRASHAGQAPEAGINAVIEAAHQALTLHRLNDLPNGTSVSVTVIQGGIATNVIPPEATLQVDVRFLKASEAQRVDRAIQSLGPVLPGAGVTVSGGIDRGPLERNEQMLRAFGQAREIAASIGLELREGGSGGASDGNFTAALGIPTLDGLGAGGLGAHAAHEQVHLRTLPRRAALLAKMLRDWDMARL